MTKEIFEIFTTQVKFKAIACKEYESANFCVLFNIKGIEYILDNIYADFKNKNGWDITNAKIYHYDCEDTKNEKDECVFCEYKYTYNQKLNESMECKELNEQMSIEAIWGTCLNDKNFVNVWNQLMNEMNPQELEKIK